MTLVNALTHSVVAVTRAVNRAALASCGVLMLALTAVVLLQVLFRYVLELPLTWSDEAARHLLVWLSFMGGGIAIAGHLHPRIELIDSLGSPRMRRGIEAFVALLILAFLVGLFVISLDVALTYNKYHSLALGLPQSVPRLALSVGAILMAINTLSKLLAADAATMKHGAPGA